MAISPCRRPSPALRRRVGERAHARAGPAATPWRGVGWRGACSFTRRPCVIPSRSGARPECPSERTNITICGRDEDIALPSRGRAARSAEDLVARCAPGSRMLGEGASSNRVGGEACLKERRSSAISIVSATSRAHPRQRDHVVGGRPAPHMKSSRPMRASPSRSRRHSRSASGRRAAPSGGAARTGRPRARRQELRPQITINRAAAPRHVPVEHELGLDQQRVQVVGRQAMLDALGDRQRRGKFHPVQMGEHVDRRPIAVFDRRRRIGSDDRLAAEVFQDEDAGSKIRREDFGRGEAPIAQRTRHGDERPHVFGEMRDRAVGQAVAHRRAVRRRGAFIRTARRAPCTSRS